MNYPTLLPFPRSFSFSADALALNTVNSISIESDFKNEIMNPVIELKKSLQQKNKRSCIINEYSSLDGVTGIIFLHSSKLRHQGYELTVSNSCVVLKFEDAAGCFYGCCTLQQIIAQYNTEIPGMHIEDYPDFPVRGAMLDISRGKIPTMETIYQMIDFLASIKINHLQLYMEGFSFAYPSFPEYWRDTTPVTGEEVLKLDKYCKERFIDLVPSINCFGHMQDWLEKKELCHLAECPDGYDCEWGKDLPPATLFPQSPESLALVRRIIGDISPFFSSVQFNVGCDETMELGKGKSSEQCRRFGKGKVYYDYLMSVYKEVGNHRKRMLFWGDIILKYPEIVGSLPKDVTVLDWGYEADYPFEEHCRKFKEAGLPYYVCSGTSSWLSITGRNDNMRLNQINAASNGLKYNAQGLLITDWGDQGHWQYLPASYAGFAFGAAVAWNLESNKCLDIADYLNMFIFKDLHKIMGHFAIECGNYYLLESKHVENATVLAKLLLENPTHVTAECSVTQEDLNQSSQLIDSLCTKLYLAQMTCHDADIIINEYETSLLILKHAIHLGTYELEKQKINNFDSKEKLLFSLIDEITRIQIRHMKVWNMRNRLSGLEKSLTQMCKLSAYYQHELQQLRSQRHRMPDTSC